MRKQMIAMAAQARKIEARKGGSMTNLTPLAQEDNAGRARSVTIEMEA